jgi:hypothetical protein
MSEKDKLWLKALTAAPSDIYFVMNKQPRCPHCGADFDIFENEAFYLYQDDGENEVTCEACDLPFTVRSVAHWSFSTEEQDEEGPA